MKKKLLGLSMLLIAGVAVGQQLPQYSQYMFNKLPLNPGVAGSEPFILVNGSHRSQWVGYDDAPVTQTLGAHSSFDDMNLGVGGYFFNDKIGALKNTGVNLAVAYHLPLDNDDMKLGFGLSGTISQFGIDGTQITLADGNDQLVDQMNNQQTNVEAGFGVYLSSPDFYFGASALQLLQPTNEIFEGGGSIPLESHYYAMGGYSAEVGDGYYLEPSFLVSYMQNIPMQIEGSILFNYQDFIKAGASYRTDDAIVLLAAFGWNSLELGYSYDITTSPIKNQSSGSHEINLSYAIFYNEAYKNIHRRYRLNKAK